MYKVNFKTKAMNPKERIFITVKDVQILTGKKQKACYAILQKIRVYFNKEKHHAITFKEFYKYFGIE